MHTGYSADTCVRRFNRAEGLFFCVMMWSRYYVLLSLWAVLGLHYCLGPRFESVFLHRFHMLYLCLRWFFCLPQWLFVWFVFMLPKRESLSHCAGDCFLCQHKSEVSRDKNC